MRPFSGRGIARALAACLLGLGFVTTVRAAEPVTVFAAASLRNAMDAAIAAWRADTGQPAIAAYAGSSALARQIQQGAPADIFVSANPDWMDVLEQDGLLRAGTRVDLLTNAIVLVAHGRQAESVDVGPSLDLPALLGDRRLAMALVEAVPAGIYGRAALENLGLWDKVEARVVQAPNVRAALALVATGEAPYGIVYRTDAAASDNVSVVGTFAAGTHPPIVYPAAVTAESGNRHAAAFLAFLKGPAARAIFERHGFGVIR
ncbi:molybdate ABC transporter substrate-binding protein [Minwuia thermotolerans]|uniref:Molybdate ABC transporter substrate-binding protein n=1 Tax=Minwuia thermotolerans TaxID=2056226 RepID=A0A2M9G3B6_9PROT|nr:molybdate ABC transporter substrate-binding protein [Minwuia thermotolerans]PJK30212.1 molybdate ABC transporter substrate-binding protein [Minwuia thermotolerans]